MGHYQNLVLSWSNVINRLFETGDESKNPIGNEMK